MIIFECAVGLNHLVQIQVTDNGTPPLRATQSFTVVVRDSEGDFDLFAGSLAARLAPKLSVPFSINSGLDLKEISFMLDISSERLREISLEPVIPELSSITLTPGGPARFHVRFVAAPGELLQGNRAIASLTFNPVAGEHSEIVTLIPHAITAVRSSGQTVPATGHNGRLVLVGREPLLLAEPGNPMTLKLFGIPDHTYVLEQTSNLNLPPAWTSLLRFKQTNLMHTFPVTVSDLKLFYRLRE